MHNISRGPFVVRSSYKCTSTIWQIKSLLWKETKSKRMGEGKTRKDSTSRITVRLRSTRMSLEKEQPWARGHRDGKICWACLGQSKTHCRKVPFYTMVGFQMGGMGERDSIAKLHDCSWYPTQSSQLLLPSRSSIDLAIAILLLLFRLPPSQHSSSCSGSHHTENPVTDACVIDFHTGMIVEAFPV